MSQAVPEPGCRLLTCCFALLQESPPEVFIEGIFQPSYKSGKLHDLENLLESIDSSLESWGKYLIAACQHLQRKNYYHILYELQQFMKVTTAPSCRRLCPRSLAVRWVCVGCVDKTVSWPLALLLGSATTNPCCSEAFLYNIRIFILIPERQTLILSEFRKYKD